MKISIGNENVFIPKGIEEWSKQNDDNKTEFDAFLNLLIKAISHNLLDKFKETISEQPSKNNPYDRLYEVQLQAALDSGMDKEDFDSMSNMLIDSLVKKSNNDTKETSTGKLEDLLKLLI